jgi:hypothetical protein
VTHSLASARLSDPAMTEYEREWYVRGFEAAMRGERAVASADVSPAQAEAWLRGHEDATREQTTPSQRALLPRKELLQLGHGSTALENAIAIKVAKRAEIAERDTAARERIANALERLCAWVEKLP